MPGWTRCAVGSAQPQGCEIVRFWADTRGSGVGVVASKSMTMKVVSQNAGSSLSRVPISAS